MTPFREVAWDGPDRSVTAEGVVRAMGRDPSDPLEIERARASLERIEREMRESSIYRNDTYQVVARIIPEARHGFACEVVHLSIKRIDREAIHDWRDLLTIKDEITSPLFDAVELYPAADRVVDTANQYHLWVFADKSFRLPIGWFEGRSVSDSKVGHSKQRPFNT